MNLPPFVKSLAFWKALCFVAAAILLWLKPDSLVTDAVLLSLVLAVLQFFGVKPELQAKGLWKK